MKMTTTPEFGFVQINLAPEKPIVILLDKPTTERERGDVAAAGIEIIRKLSEMTLDQVVATRDFMRQLTTEENNG